MATNMRRKKIPNLNIKWGCDGLIYSCLCLFQPEAIGRIPFCAQEAIFS